MGTNKAEETKFSSKVDNAMNYFFMTEEFYKLTNDERIKVLIGMVDFCTTQVTKITEGERNEQVQ